ncbi:MAG: hypothetical protein M0R06_01430 [Sphaerochaeta sp.]|jgi:hypothetical protein|nr:hypothetical protein [Sphaerochaeta sp.]
MALEKTGGEMAKARLIASSIFEDEWYGVLPFFEQQLWVGLFARCADDQGRLLDNPILIRAAVFPYKDILIKDIEGAIAQFAAAGRITRYIKDNKMIIQINNWWEHQHPQWASKSKWFAPDGWTDRIRTRENNHYVEENWRSPEPVAEVQVNEPQEVQVESQIYVPVPVNVPVNIPNSYDSIPEKTPRKARAKQKAPDTELDLDKTPTGRELAALLGKNAAAKGRRGPIRFPTIEVRDKFLETSEKLGYKDTKAAIAAALTQGIYDMVGVVNYAAKWSPNGPKSNGKGKPNEPIRDDNYYIESLERDAAAGKCEIIRELPPL